MLDSTQGLTCHVIWLNFTLRKRRIEESYPVVSHEGGYIWRLEPNLLFDTTKVNIGNFQQKILPQLMYYLFSFCCFSIATLSLIIFMFDTHSVNCTSFSFKTVKRYIMMISSKIDTYIDCLDIVLRYLHSTYRIHFDFLTISFNGNVVLTD